MTVRTFNYQYLYKAIICDVYDGDTVTAEIDLGFDIKMKRKLRLMGINAPEVRGKERELGLKSRDRLRELVLDKQVVVQTVKDKTGKYGRYLAFIHIPDISYVTDSKNWDWHQWKDVANILVDEGLAEFVEY